MAAFVIGVASVTKTITVKRPGREEEEFTAEIRIRDYDEQEALREQEEKGELKARSHFRDDLLSIGGLEDKDGKAVECTPELMDAMMKDPYASMGIMRAWHEVQRGLPESTAKN